jgi:hypothetical protein
LTPFFGDILLPHVIATVSPRKVTYVETSSTYPSIHYNITLVFKYVKKYCIVLPRFKHYTHPDRDITPTPDKRLSLREIQKVLPKTRRDTPPDNSNKMRELRIGYD